MPFLVHTMPIGACLRVGDTFVKVKRTSRRGAVLVFKVAANTPVETVRNPDDNPFVGVGPKWPLPDDGSFQCAPGLRSTRADDGTCTNCGEQLPPLADRS